MIRMVCRAVLLASCVAVSERATAQEHQSTRPGKRSLLERDREIALARSAAPAEVSGAAAVYVLTDTGYARAVAGANGNACLVNRSWPASIEPHCFDSEGRATIMQIELFRMRGVQRGVSPAEIDRDIADGIAHGRFRLPRRPAMSYMMSGAQQLVSDDGRPVGRWQPHLMLYIPYITAADLGLGATPNSAAAMVSNAGTPLANIMVVVKAFIEPAATGPSTP